MALDGTAEDPRFGWPYAVQSLLDAPSAALIEDHASILLSRALNTGRVVAFVGAGASMAYGRISWRDLVMSAQRRVLDAYERAVDEIQRRPRVKATHELLVAHALQPGKRDRPNHYTTVFRLAEQLSDALAHARVEPRSDFRSAIIEATEDDRGQGRQIYADGMEGKERIDGKEGKERLEEFEARGTRLDFRRRHYLKKLRETVGSQAISATGPCIHLLEAADAAMALQTKYILPLHRYLNGTLLKLLAHEDKIPAVWKTERIARRRLIRDRHRDPLLILLERLGIDRFLTTNYDFEIEHLFADQGHRRSEDASPLERKAWRDDPMGPPSSDFVFSPERIGELAAFAIRDRGKRTEVGHLHGRAEKGGEIVATDRDYIGRYARFDEAGDMMRRVTRLAFASNPILFVGSGMGEDDLLRPLREFMSTPERMAGRTAIALIPDEADDEKVRELEKIRRLNENGAYIVHYGQAGGRGDVMKPWLPHLAALRRLLDEAMGDTAASDDARRKKIIELLHKLNEVAGVSADPKPGMPLLVTPAIIEGCSTERGKVNGFDISVEMSSFRAACSLVLHREEIDDAHIERLTSACKHALAGAYDGILGAFLCARLLRVRRDWERWRADWWQMPIANPLPRKHPGTDAPCKFGTGDPAGTVIVRRHAIMLEESPGKIRFYADAPSQTVNAFLGALDTWRPVLESPPPGRRVFLMLGRRGVGKGHFFSSLQAYSKEGATQLQALLGAIGGENSKAQWAAAAFYNLSFSNEVASVFDGLGDFILEHASVLLDNKAAEKLEVEIRNVTGRIDRLRYILRELKQAHRTSGNGRQTRLLIAINSVGVLFEPNGRAKNAQVTRVFNALLGEDGADAPIDLILVCAENSVPAFFRGDKAMLLKIDRKELTEKARLALEERVQRIGLATVAGRTPENTGSEAAVTHTMFVHFLHEDRASVVLSQFFPSVALLVAWNEIREPGTARTHVTGDKELDQRNDPEDQRLAKFSEIIGADRSRRYPNVFTRPSAEVIRGQIRSVLSDSSFKQPHEAGADIAEYTKRCLGRTKILYPRLLAAAAIVFELRLDWCDVLLKDRVLAGALKTTIGDDKGHRDLESPGYAERAISTALVSLIKSAAGSMADHLNAALLDHLAGRIDASLGRIYDATGRNRYALTLLAAITYEDMFPVVRLEGAGVDADYLRQVAGRATATLERIQRETSDKPMTRRDSVVIEQVMQKIKRRHERNELYPSVVNTDELPDKGRIDGVPDGKSLELFDLQRWILWYLAVIGQPTEAAVLARCPAVIEICEKIDSDSYRRHPEKIEALLDRVLVLLNRRCLVFPIEPYRSGDKKAGGKPRFAIHRRLQRNILQRLGAPFVEYPEVDQFTMTTFATQPNDLPRLSPEAYRQLHKAVSALSGDPESLETSETYRETKDRAVQRQMLRASLGILRSVYSVATLGRLNREHKNPKLRDSSPEDRIERGYFEEHRLQIRWLVHQVVALQARCQKEGVKIEYPFYAEEIVWLMNECGTLSLIQGRLSDAVTLLETAQKFANSIETEETGAIRTRIGLNQVAVEIDRGRFQAARRRLVGMVDLKDEHEVIPLIARGYLGLIEHLTGKLDQAKLHYLAALEGPDHAMAGAGGRRPGLVQLGHTRAASIFYKHLGDLCRGQKHIDDATRYLNLAINLASEGGHQDISTFALLGKALVDLEKRENPDLRSIFAQVDEITAYARMVGMPRIDCEVETLRARALQAVGDLKGAAEAALKGLSVSTIHDLRLRKAKAAVAIAEISVQRNMREIAGPLVEAALEIATDSDYFLALSHAQRLAMSLNNTRRS